MNNSLVIWTACRCVSLKLGLLLSAFNDNKRMNSVTFKIQYSEQEACMVRLVRHRHTHTHTHMYGTLLPVLNSSRGVVPSEFSRRLPNFVTPLLKILAMGLLFAPENYHKGLMNISELY